MMPFDLIIASARKRGYKVIARRPGQALLQCGASDHPDNHPSVSLSEGDDGRALIYCHARKCDPARILSGYGLTLGDLFPKDSRGTHLGKRGAR